jgi:hypothetical protein
VLHDVLEFIVCDGGEVRDPREGLPCLCASHAAELEREREQLMHEHRPAPVLYGDRLDPTFACELH